VRHDGGWRSGASWGRGARGGGVGGRRRGASQSFSAASIWSRALLAAAFVLLVAAGESPRGLLALAALNALGAYAMGGAVRATDALMVAAVGGGQWG